jgi:hypothetical protein
MPPPKLWIQLWAEPIRPVSIVGDQSKYLLKMGGGFIKKI